MITTSFLAMERPALPWTLPVRPSPTAKHIGTRGYHARTGTSSIPGELDVYGLKPN
jgi:hypothetical protein